MIVKCWRLKTDTRTGDVISPPQTDEIGVNPDFVIEVEPLYKKPTYCAITLHCGNHHERVVLAATVKDTIELLNKSK